MRTQDTAVRSERTDSELLRKDEYDKNKEDNGARGVEGELDKGEEEVKTMFLDHMQEGR